MSRAAVGGAYDPVRGASVQILLEVERTAKGAQPGPVAVRALQLPNVSVTEQMPVSAGLDRHWCMP
jgi:hypothetical protein